MTGIITTLLGGGVKGPSGAEKAAQLDAANRAAEQRAEADRLAALSDRIGSRRQALGFREKDRLGG